MGWVVLVVVAVMLLLSIVVYKAVFKRVFKMRKTILHWVRHVIAQSVSSDKAKLAIKQDNLQEAFTIYQDIFKTYESSEIKPTEDVNAFFANVSPEHKKYYELANSLRQSVVLSTQKFNEVSQKLGLCEVYKQAMQVLLALHNEQIITLPNNFMCYRPDKVLPVNVGYLIAKGDIHEASQDEIAKINLALEVLNNLPADEIKYIPLRFPADAMYLNFYFNEACDNNIAILLSLSLIWRVCLNEENQAFDEVERECKEYASFLAKVVLSQFKLFWMLGWHAMLPVQSEQTVFASLHELLETNNHVFKDFAQYLTAFAESAPVLQN